MYSLECAAQTYNWGRPGTSSLVAKFLQNVQDTHNYAELWMGGHPALPSRIHGKPISETFSSVPFLFKILSVAKPLSIQVHPNKPQAQELHSTNSILYPDNNHKPEMCIAVTPMTLLYGFKPAQQISDILSSSESFRSLAPYASDVKSLLRHLYDNSYEYTQKLTDYLESQPQQSLPRMLSQHFPNDLGIVVAMLMNYVELSPGESIVIHPGTCHCYLEGDCIEAMACSDNVIRAGLTPKPKDLDTLLKILNESAELPAVLHGLETQPGCFQYSSPYSEFQVLRLELEGQSIEVHKSGPVIMVVLQGRASATYNGESTEMLEGKVYVSDRNLSISGHGTIYACYSNNAN